MGGGAAMRVATKLAKIGGLRGFVGETPVVSSVATQQPFASSTLEDGHLGVAIGKVEQPFHALPAWDLDDWEFDGEELVTDKNSSSSSSSPRVVFGPVPTIEEAKEATEELKEALDKIYLSSSPVISATGSDEGSSTAASGLHEEEDSKTKVCISPAESSIVPTVPNQALEAFKMLREKLAIQGVVASIASDPNIWNAVIQNKAFVEYCQSGGESSVGKLSSNVNNNSDDESSFSCTAESEATNPTPPKSKAEKFLEDLIENVKVEVSGIAKKVNVEAAGIAKNVKTEVVGIANNVADFFQDLFGTAKKKSTTPEGGATTADGFQNGVFAIGGSIMGLVMMVIMVLAMKRV